MQRHQLNLIGLFFALAALHHVAQGKAGDDLRQGHRLVDFRTLQHFGHPAEELVNVLHPHLSGFRAGRGFVQPGLIVDAVNKIAHRRHRLALRETLHFAEPVGESR